MTLPTRRRFVAEVLRQLKLPYQWNGKGYLPLEAAKLGVAKPLFEGRDCSGCMTFAYWRAGGADLRAIGNAEYLRANLTAPAMVRTGALCLYGRTQTATEAPHASHVMMLLEPGLLVGADGGDETTTTLAEALRREAMVSVREFIGYRGDFLGYREFPFGD